MAEIIMVGQLEASLSPDEKYMIGPMIDDLSYASLTDRPPFCIHTHPQ